MNDRIHSLQKGEYLDFELMIFENLGGFEEGIHDLLRNIRILHELD